MKIIDKDLKSDLIRIKDIRNAFAHGFLGLSFNTEEIRNVCNLLKTPTAWSEDGPMPARKQFVFACVVLWLKFGDFADGFVYSRSRVLS